MNHTRLNVRSVPEKCARFIARQMSISKGPGFTVPTQNSATRSTQGARNIGSDLRFYIKRVKTCFHVPVRFTARSHRGFSASPKGLACAVAVAIGISLFLPMEQVSQASIVPTKMTLKAYAKAKVPTSQEACLLKLWGKESAWNYLADNPHSTAFGIPQILGMKTTNPYKQIDLGIKYIKHRYSTPCKAWRFHKRNNYY